MSKGRVVTLVLVLALVGSGFGWRLVDLHGMTMENVWDMFSVAFAGHDSLLSRLQEHTSRAMYSEEPPDTATDLKRVKLAGVGRTLEYDLEPRMGLVRYDRYSAARMMEADLGALAAAPRLELWWASLHPHRTLFKRDHSASPGDRSSIREVWPA